MARYEQAEGRNRRERGKADIDAEMMKDLAGSSSTQLAKDPCMRKGKKAA
jgi:hypothetical protein